ncbi:two-component system LytT family sensor kinase [Parabacteroides sp. PF5-5]|uniref:sensor histidine kinase n=1 Tax=unclassified Parabacteroides TaxID=2649774 RepID=UPI002476C5FE|nr:MULTISPECIES: histidine kinase [unclassified Parabacteroides]MDH6305292.1 two-component system LytT family sensor kinase [Parabacteroides sp. PH5-39]MDH6316645.1 two-component system LytT family sensor kinase [Parabacteroides sp. PF5-13]MDH6320175.1 two-component system LytT family sensor kinase [Parabacteroides sp. PH5-13]MDH6323882.1 two-component system LytT family sensor kinase [Parabacteroides sp. PH5-8]MDH6327852.1 two-component system LytT family sensor kinase [Parabacteroides sp. PH
MEIRTDKDKISSFLLDDKFRIYRHLLLQLIILMITIGNFFDAPDKLNLTWNRFYGWIGYYLFLNVLVYFNVYVLYPRFLAKNKMLLYIVSVIIFTVFMMFGMMILQEYFYDIAVIHQEPSAAAIFFSIASSLLSMFLFIGGVAAFLLFKQWIQSNQRVYDLKAATSESELKFLKSQINPHFLFNMLNNANILIDEEPDMASGILIKLKELLQYQLNDSLQDKVNLQADIRFLANYLELEKTRRDKFDYEISKNGELENVSVAPLLFIPFVENAVKHNATNEGDSFVRISFSLYRERLTFICQNSIPSVESVKKEKGGLGLINIKRRLDLLFGNNYSLEQTKADNIYTVKLQINV